MTNNMPHEYGDPFLKIDEDIELEATYRIAWLIEYYESDPTLAGIRFNYDVIVRNGPQIDILLMTDEEFQYYEDESRWRCIDEFSQRKTVTNTQECILELDEYDFVLDHGYHSEPEQWDDALVSVKAEARPIYNI